MHAMVASCLAADPAARPTVPDLLDSAFLREGERERLARLREARDATLAMPRLIIPSLQVNMRAGDLPPPDESGKRFLKVPINGL